MSKSSTSPAPLQGHAMRTGDARLSENNFDLVRLLLAAAVCLAHAYVLSGHEELAGLARTFSSTVAVKAFFVVSGFLIVMSYERSSSLRSFAEKRVRRIYPAYFTVIVLCAVGLFLVSSVPADVYFSTQWLRYVLSNLVFLNFVQPTLPGVFDSNLTQAVNGALWTLKIEVMFYASVPAIVWAVRRYGALKALAALYLASLLYSATFLEIASRTNSPLYTEVARQLPGQLTYFVSGAFLYYFRDFFCRNAVWFLLPAALVQWLDLYVAVPVLEPFALAVVVSFAGLFAYLGNFARYGDFSYGIYIVHFPIVQTTLSLGVLKEDPWLYLLLVGFLTIIAGAAMWHLIEKRFLSRSSHYRGTDPGRPRP